MLDELIDVQQCPASIPVDVLDPGGFCHKKGVHHHLMSFDGQLLKGLSKGHSQESESDDNLHVGCD